MRRARNDDSTPDGNSNDTVPAIEDCKLLEFNKDTRWTSKYFTNPLIQQEYEMRESDSHLFCSFFPEIS